MCLGKPQQTSARTTMQPRRSGRKIPHKSKNESADTVNKLLEKPQKFKTPKGPAMCPGYKGTACDNGGRMHVRPNGFDPQKQEWRENCQDTDSWLLPTPFQAVQPRQECLQQPNLATATDNHSKDTGQEHQESRTKGGHNDKTVGRH